MKIQKLETNNIQPQDEFTSEIISQLKKLFSTQLDGTFSMINWSAGFHYFIQYGSNNYYNINALHDIDIMPIPITPDSDTFKFSNQYFSTLYCSILKDARYVFSQADQGKINTESDKTSELQITVQNEWKNVRHKPTAEEKAAAQVETDMDYIVYEVMNDEQLQPLLDGDVDKVPPQYASFGSAYLDFQNAAQFTLKMNRTRNDANNMLKSAINNTLTPSDANKGMQTDTKEYYVRYEIPDATKIYNDLNNTGNIIKVVLSLEDFTSTDATLNINGKGKIPVSYKSIFSIKVDSKAEYNLSQLKTSDLSLEIEMTYPGVTLVSTRPTAQSAKGDTWWYNNLILKEIVENDGKDATGYKLMSTEFPVSKYFGNGQEFRRIGTFVISKAPTIKMTFTSSQLSDISTYFTQSAKAKIKILGIDFISASENYTIDQVDTISREGKIQITLCPPVDTVQTANQDKTAYILGGVISYPPNDA